jgi:hypothetical protein
MARQLLSARRAAALEREASARIRRDFMELQRKFTEVEDFLYALGAPQFSVAVDVRCTAASFA